VSSPRRAAKQARGKRKQGPAGSKTGNNKKFKERESLPHGVVYVASFNVPTVASPKLKTDLLNFRQAFLERANRGVIEILESLGPKDLASAVAAPTDAGVLMVALERAGGIGVLTKDPLAEAKLLGQKRRLQQLELEGGTLSSDDVAALLKISRQAVVKKIDAGTLFAIKLGSSFAIPAWQIEDHKPLPGLKEVLKALSGEDDWRKLSFFVNGNVRLGGKSPLQELRAGHRDEVIAAARTLLEHGAS
jgi:excisionase family DNA binding protein